MNKMRKAIVSVVIIVIFLSSISGIALYYHNLLNDSYSKISSLESTVANQTDEIEEYQSQVSILEGQLANLTSNLKPNARIINATADKSWYTPVGGVLYFLFNATVKNISNETINGAQLTVQKYNAKNSVTSGSIGLESIGDIKPEETRQVQVVYSLSYDNYIEYKASSFLLILSINGITVLDYQILN